ncbi:MAG: TonB-dependent receptor [Acidobacteriota bacterium]
MEGSVRGSQRTWLAGAWALAAVALLLVNVAPAAGQIADAAIDIQVVDQQNLALPGVTVQVKSPATGLRRLAVTAEDGTTRIAALPPGTYEVHFELSGFAPLVQENVVLRVGQTARVIATMQTTTTEEITVTAEAPLVDVYKSDVSTNILPEQIEMLPVADRDFQKLAFIAPGVQRERGGYRFISGAPVLGAGGNASNSTIMVDGVDYTDQALGLARTRFSQDSIREFRVITNRFDTEVGQSAGGVLSVVTRSGSNTLSGSFFGFYRADSLRTQGKLETGDQNFNRYQAGFTVGGPITRDKTHFFASFEYINEDNIALFRPLGAYASQKADVAHPFNQVLLLGSLDHRINDNQSLQVKLVGERYREENFRVGGVADESSGMQLNRDNWNLTAGHVWVLGGDKLNNLRFQMGRKNFDEPNNSAGMSEYFTFGTTLITGANIVGDQEMTGDYLELRDTYQLYKATAKSSHDIKLGGSVQLIKEDWNYPIFPHGLMFWANDTRTLPYRYDYAVGDPNTSLKTKLFGLFAQDDIRLGRNLTVSLGLRYDYDSDGNNPDFTHPVVPKKRSVDKDNIQPRLSVVWDLSGDGASILRGGAGQFTGRYLLVPSFVEKQQNGVTGRTLYTRLNGMFFGLPAAYWMSGADPQHTGLLLAKNAALLASSLEAPEALQSSLGFTQRLGDSGLFLDLEAVYVDGDNEIIVRDVNWSGNATHVRPNAAWAQINMYTNQGHSKYKALTASLNGTLHGGHLLAASVTYQDKKNISDDFSPALVEYPSDPADIEAEWGCSRSDERWRAVVSGVFRLPWELTVAPIYEYGAGQPWNRRLGYDYNGDGKTSDRIAGVKKYDQDGPNFRSFSLRITKGFTLGAAGRLDLIVEGFNLFDNVNYDPNSVSSAKYLSGPTIANPAAAYVANPSFGKYFATLPPREIQLGLRYSF